MAGLRVHAFTAAAGGTDGVDDQEVRAGEENIGATIIGRNMFGPVRGPWPDHSWTRWWGPNPPYHHDVFVLTHYPRPTLEMEGGTTFHFVDEPPQRALALASEAAGAGRTCASPAAPRPCASSCRRGLSTSCTW